jgi:general secretion pathway protein G
MNYNTVNRLQNNKAFTLIEFAFVLMIVSLLVAIIIPAVTKLEDSARTGTTEDEIVDIQTDIDDFFDANGFYPDSLDELFDPDPVPLDPWGNPYQYLNHDTSPSPGKWRKDKNLVPINSDYDLYSKGPDGKSASPLTSALSHDDIVRGRNGAYIGLALYY